MLGHKATMVRTPPEPLQDLTQYIVMKTAPEAPSTDVHGYRPCLGKKKRAGQGVHISAHRAHKPPPPTPRFVNTLFRQRPCVLSTPGFAMFHDPHHSITVTYLTPCILHRQVLFGQGGGHGRRCLDKGGGHGRRCLDKGGRGGVMVGRKSFLTTCLMTILAPDSPSLRARVRTGMEMHDARPLCQRS